MFSYTTTLRNGKPPRLPYRRIKDHVLGKKYDLSLVFVGSTLSKSLNKKHRDKNMPASVLSFPLDSETGEIFIDLRRAEKDAPKNGRSVASQVAFLYIHALFHLKGLAHGSKMERAEHVVRESFNIKV